MSNNLFIEPKQKRSKESLERLINASARQIAIGNFDNVSVTDIAKQAKCSVGTFYGRFKNKAALFQVVQDRVFETALSYLEARIETYEQQVKASPLPANTRQASTEAVTFAVDLAIDFYTENRGVFRALFLHTRTIQDPILLERVRRFNAAGMQASIRILETTMIEPSADDVKQWREGLEIILVYLRESILFGDPVVTDETHEFTAMKAVAINMLTAFIANIERV